MSDPQRRARSYALWRRWLWLADLAFTSAVIWAFVSSGLSQRLAAEVQRAVPGWLPQALAFVAVAGGGLMLLTLPLDWFRGFALEHRFGLSTQRIPQWLWEHAKQLAVGGALGLVTAAGFIALLRLRPGDWWVWAAAAWVLWSVLLTRLAPTWLIPIFYRQRPLADPALQQRIERLLEKCGTTVRGIFEINLSKTTRKSNACLCGMGASRRVLVSDTLLESHPPEEIEVVLAHEVGHHRLHHLPWLIGVSAAATGLSCAFVDLAARAWLSRIGLALSDPAALPVFALLFTGAGLALMPAVNGISRALEDQADRYALAQTRNPRAFIATMRRLAERNLSELTPPAWVEWLFYDHPSIHKRIALAERLRLTEECAPGASAHRFEGGA